ncbi:hypothetical protein B7486_72935 [cyanobacterium TDX16]|nr:hypothetical protein B7486_72935 [cyanobacterium TDX16]
MAWWQRQDVRALRTHLLDDPQAPLRRVLDPSGLDQLLAQPVDRWRTAQQHWSLLVVAAWLDRHPGLA